MNSPLREHIISVTDAESIKNAQWVDVRCPREFLKGHYPNAINLPIFSDLEYEEIGTIYRKAGRVEATRVGREYAKKSTHYITKKISEMNCDNLIIYCARGGMRSKGVHEVLNKSIHNVYRIDGGYKSIRKFTLDGFSLARNIVVIAGSTGTGKTKIIKELNCQNQNAIDLEELARHRGSAFGDLGIKTSVTQQQFENELSYRWRRTSDFEPLFIESESRKIGKIVIPKGVWDQMQEGYYIKIEVELSRRVENLMNEYGGYPIDEHIERVNKILNRLGGQNAKHAVSLLKQNELEEFCKLLLEKYYDKMYNNAYISRQSKKNILSGTGMTYKQIIKKIQDLI